MNGTVWFPIIDPSHITGDRETWRQHKQFRPWIMTEQIINTQIKIAMQWSF
jgi:hypothetical protein